jgi:hypothetical protein
MRVSEWRASAPHRDAMTAKVLAVVDPVLRALGCETNPHAWVAWGEDPATRYSILAPTPSGLAVCHVRVNVPGEGPRASGKIVRWSRAQLGELGVETQAGHRIVSFQVDQQVLRGVDDDADHVAAFAIALFAASDGRPIPDLGAGRKPGRSRRSAAKTGATRGTPASGSTARTPSARRSSTSRSAAG